MGELEGGARVVVQPAHQPMVERVRNAGGVEGRSNRGEVNLRVLVEEVGDYRQRVDDRLVGRNLAVQHAQRIGDGAALAVRAHLADDRNEGGAQGFVVAGAVRGRAHRV